MRRWWWRWIALACVSGPTIARAAPPTEPVRYDGHAIARVDVPDLATLDALMAAGAEPLGDRPHPGVLPLRIPPSAAAMLGASGLPYAIAIADVQPRIDEERARLAAGAPIPGQSFFADFRDFATVDAYLDTLAADAPALASVVEVGDSLEGRTIRGLSIGAASGQPAAVLLTGTMHAREWLATSTATCLADRLVHGYATDPAITDALDHLEIIVVPVLNPDGYVYSWDVDRYWRKNTRDGHGVDLNRNFPYEWGGEGSSGDPNAQDYRGSEALSEPEAQALADFITARPELVAHVDYHTFGQWLLYPWSDTPLTAPDDAELSALAQAQVDAMASAHGVVYSPITGATLYPASGVVDDWVYGERGVFPFVPELRPTVDGPGDFVVPPSEIEPTCDEALAGLMVLLDWAAQQSDPGGTSGTDEGDGEADSTADGNPDDTGGGTAGGGDDAADADADTGTRPPNPLDDGDGDGDDDGTASGSDGTGADAGLETSADGCSCRAHHRAPRPAWLVLVLLGLRRRPRVQPTPRR